MSKIDAITLSEQGLQARASGRLQDALDCQQQAVSLAPDNWGIQTNLGTALLDIGLLSEAISAFAEASQRSAHPLPITNLGMAWLWNGFMARGFRAFLARWRVIGWPQKSYHLSCRHALPDATELPASSLLTLRKPLTLTAGRLVVLPDQGYGDTLMALPFVRTLLRVRPDTTVLVKTPLLSVVRTALGDVTDNVFDESAGPFEAWLTGFDIPAFIPESIGEYEGERQLIEGCLKRLFRAESLVSAEARIGVVWRGNPHYSLDRWRSADPNVMGAMLRGIDATPLCLIPDIHEKEREIFYCAAGRPLVTVSVANFADTAQALMSCCALLTTDTAIAHLGGLLGMPTVLLVSAFGDWRWGKHDDRVWWYPSIIPKRQEAPGDWSGVVDPVHYSIERVLDKYGLLY